MSKRTNPLDINRFPSSAVPVGTVSITCCPTMAGMQRYWSGSGPVTKAASKGADITKDVDKVVSCPTTFGFDIQTNVPCPPDRGKKEYWNRPGAPGTSGGRRDLDGSTWVCVKEGGTADVEIRFIGYADLACIKNVSICVDDVSKATITPTAFTDKSAKLTIQGVAEGECTVLAECGGKPIGWCHVAVYSPGVVNVSVWRVNLQDASGANLTSAAAITAAEITTISQNLDQVYGQCAVSWIVQNQGTITYSTAASITNYNNTLANGKAPLSVYPQFFSDFAANSTPTAAPGIDLYYFEPVSFATGVAGYNDSGGIANGIPSFQCMIFAPTTGSWGQTLLPHELGHCLGLFHPNDPRAAASQLPDNFRLPLLTSGTSTNSDNVMYSDHINVMGYGSGAPPNAALRYGQWSVVQSIV